MPTNVNPPAGVSVTAACCHDVLPAGSTSMPRFVPSTTVPAGLAASEVASPAAGATAAGPAVTGSIRCQLDPPSADAKISFFCSPPRAGADRQADTRFVAFAAASSAPAGCPSGCAVPTAQGIRDTGRHGALPSTGPAYSV